MLQYVGEILSYGKKRKFHVTSQRKKTKRTQVKKKKQTVPNLCGVEPFFWTKVQAILKIPP